MEKLILRCKPVYLLFILVNFCLSFTLQAQVPSCTAGSGNTLVQINSTPITVSLKPGSCVVTTPNLLPRWVATPGPGYTLIALMQAPSAGTNITLNGATVCPNGKITVVVIAIFHYFGNPTDPSDDVICSRTGMDCFTAKDDTAPTFMLPPSFTIAITTDCVVDAIDVKALLKAAHVKDNCTNKATLLANAWVTECAPNPNNACPAGSECWTYHTKDACGNEAMQNVEIVIMENVPPVINLPANFTLYADENCQISNEDVMAILMANHVSDNCTDDETLLANAVVLENGPGCVAPPFFGIARVTCPVNPGGPYCFAFQTFDNCGNPSNIETINIWVRDTVAPALVCPVDFGICWPDPNYPFENFTGFAEVIEGCDRDCELTCIIYSQRILGLTNPARGPYGNNVYPTIDLSEGPRVATIRICAQDLCGNGALNPPLEGPLPTNCCTFNLTITYDEGCGAPPIVGKNTGIKTKKNSEKLLDKPIVIETAPAVTESIKQIEAVELEMTAYPNPFEEMTTVEFNLAEQETYQFIVQDAQGRILYKADGMGNSGTNQLILTKEDLQDSAITYCMIRTAKASKTILLVNSN